MLAALGALFGQKCHLLLRILYSISRLLIFSTVNSLYGDKSTPELAGFVYPHLPGQAANHEANAWHAKMCVDSTASVVV